MRCERYAPTTFRSPTSFARLPGCGEVHEVDAGYCEDKESHEPQQINLLYVFVGSSRVARKSGHIDFGIQVHARDGMEIIAHGFAFVFCDFRVAFDEFWQFGGDVFGFGSGFQAQICICRTRVRWRQPVVPRSALANALRHGGGDEIVLKPGVVGCLSNDARDLICAAKQVVIYGDCFAYGIGGPEKFLRDGFCYNY